MPIRLARSRLKTSQAILENQVLQLIVFAEQAYWNVVEARESLRVQKETFFGRMFRRHRQAQGTRSYMSPEQIRCLPLDGRADIYSFGVSSYELVTGRPPFRAASNDELLKKHMIEKPSSPQMYNKDVTDEFADLVLRMLAKKREDRPRDFHQVLMDLRKIRIFKSQASSPSEQEMM